MQFRQRSNALKQVAIGKPNVRHAGESTWPGSRMVNLAIIVQAQPTKFTAHPATHISEFLKAKIAIGGSDNLL